MTKKRTTIKVQSSLDLKTHIRLKVLGVQAGLTLAEVVSRACAYAATRKAFQGALLRGSFQERKP